MGKRSSEYQRAYLASPTRIVEEAYKNNVEYRRSRRSAEMAHRVIDWEAENDENGDSDVGHAAGKKKAVVVKGAEKQVQRTQKTQTPSNRRPIAEVSTQTPPKPVRDVATNGEVQVERESRSVKKKRNVNAEVAQKADRNLPKTAAESDASADREKAEQRESSESEEDEPEERQEAVKGRNAEEAPPKIDIVKLLKSVRTKPSPADSKRNRGTSKKRADEYEGRVVNEKPQRGRVQALFEVESNRPVVEAAQKRPNLYLFGAGDRSRNGMAVKRTYNVLAPQSAVYETALRAAKRREAERANAKNRKRPLKGSKSSQNECSVEQSEFEKWMRRETSQWTTEYRSNFKMHDRAEYARNRDMASRCSVVRDEEDLIAIALNPSFDGAKGLRSKVKVRLDSLPNSARSGSTKSTSRSMKSSGSLSART